MASVVGSESRMPTGRIGQTRSGETPNHLRLCRPGESPQTLASLIEAEIIPRMLLAHRDDRGLADDMEEAVYVPLTTSGDAETISVMEAHAFADLALEKDAYVLIEHVMRWRTRGVRAESIMLDLLAPAARRIGQYWEDDICDFVDVTMALWRLQEIIHELAARDPGTTSEGPLRRALFAVMPGDQHSFGIVMVEEFFRRAGWNTWSMTHGERDELMAMVRRNDVDLVVLTVGYDRHVDELPELIAALRKMSRNPQLRVMVGGSAVACRPEVAIAAGADVVSNDPREAIARAENLLEMHAYPDTSRR